MPTTPTGTETVITLPCVDGLCDLSDNDLVALMQSAGSVQRQVDARLAIIAGELQRRSDRALGHDGLAARLGAASAPKAIQALTGVSFSEAKALTTVGESLASPWLAPMEHAVSDGTLSVASAAAIAAGLGQPTVDVAADDLQDAAAALVELAHQSTPEHTAQAARQLREQLDVERIADIEAYRYAQRSLKSFLRADGMTKTIIISDPESTTILLTPIETVLSPRRGGPRFVDDQDPDRTEQLMNDTRTNEQLALDTLVDIVKLAVRASGTEVDPGKLFGSRSPAVRVHVEAESLKTGTGVAYFEGHPGSVSVATAERYICDTGVIPIVFKKGRAVDVGNTQRLHSVKDRIALAAQWNGCPVGNCDKPATMTEVHHIQAFNGTNTTLENGICLCRFHHMELHANGWSIQITADGTYWMIPQPGLNQSPIPLRSRSPYAPI